MASTHKPLPPKAMYPMYPEEQKAPKPKLKKEDRVCLCLPKRKKHKSVVAEIEKIKRKTNSKLEFWSVYGVPYFLVIQGIVSSIMCLTMGVVYWNDCPGLPVLNPVLIGRFILAFLDVLSLFLMSAEAFDWSKSYYWVSKITDKLNWRIISGLLLALFVVWGTALFNSTHERYTHDNPVSYDPKSPFYCHRVLYGFAKVIQGLMLLLLASSALLFLVGGTVLLCLLCIISRIP